MHWAVVAFWEEQRQREEMIETLFSESEDDEGDDPVAANEGGLDDPLIFIDEAEMQGEAVQMEAILLVKLQKSAYTGVFYELTFKLSGKVSNP